MAQRLRLIDAGPLHEAALYPICNPADSRTVRSGKKALSKEARQRINDAAGWRKLERLVAVNFRPGDPYPTLTYDDAHLPSDRKAVQRDMRRFVARLREIRRRKGKELRYIYVIEHKHHSCDGRWHVHLLINGTGDDYADILSAWAGRGHVDIRPLRCDRDKNFESLARYLCKEPMESGRDKLGQRMWSSSHNLRKPETDRQNVPNSYRIEIPRDAIVLFDTGSVETVYGYMRTVKWISPRELGGSVRAKRRRQR